MISLPCSISLRRLKTLQCAYLLSLVIIGMGCQSSRSLPQPVTWQQQLSEQLSLMGHRNWIMVADSAYPLQTSPGIQMIETGSGHLEVLDQVCMELGQVEHVSGIFYLDSELSYLGEDQAMGIGSIRDALLKRLSEHPSQHLPHATLMEKLGEAGESFKVLILKTDLTLPYTSVFIELDCGYWGPEKEQTLRAMMP